MPTFLEVIKTLGGIAGIVALVWRGWDEFGAHLRISIKVDGPQNGWVTALTTVDNKGNRPKDISYAFLLIGPESESPLDTARILAKIGGYNGPLSSTNDFADFFVEEGLFHVDRAMVPLTFYYSENFDIADETLTYRMPIPIKNFTSAMPYSVRFFLFPVNRLHRSTQDCFVVAGPSQTNTDNWTE
jgi:hypothetical protein